MGYISQRKLLTIIRNHNLLRPQYLLNAEIELPSQKADATLAASTPDFCLEETNMSTPPIYPPQTCATHLYSCRTLLQSFRMCMKRHFTRRRLRQKAGNTSRVVLCGRRSRQHVVLKLNGILGHSLFSLQILQKLKYGGRVIYYSFVSGEKDMY